MTIFEQSLETLEAQFKTATDAIVAQYKVATEAVLLAQKTAYNVKNHEFDVYNGDKSVKVCNKPERVACETVAAPTSPAPFYAPGIDTSIPVSCTAVPLPRVKEPRAPAPRAFVAPPAQDIHAESVTIGTDGVVHVSWAPGAAPVVPLTAVPMVKTERPPPPPAPGLPVGASAAPWTPPPPIAWDWPTLPPEGTPALVFVPGRPPATMEVMEQDDVDDILQPGDINDAWCPEAGQTWEDEPEPVDLRSEARLPGPPAPPTPAPVVQTPLAAPAKLGDPSRDPNRRAARFVPDTASRRSKRVSRLTDGGEPKLASVRSVELREAARSDLKALLSIVYVGPNGRPLMNYEDVADMDTDPMVGAVLAHEVAKGWVTGEQGAVN